MKHQKKLLIVGAVPPPIGGVSIHLERVLKWMESKEYKFSFCSTQNGYISNILKSSRNHQVIHLHISNSKLRVFLVFILRFILGKRVIITVHGKIGKHKGFIDYNLDKIALLLVNTPILLNTATFNLAQKINSKSVIFTPFIPPSNKNLNLPELLKCEIDKFITNSTQIFCTNASSLAYDQTGNEIYGITSLVKVFSELKDDKKIIISDPTGENYKYCKDNLTISDNIFFITQPHNFSGIIDLSHCFIRATTTDGDPLSVKESLHFNTPVIASNCIERPKTVITYQTQDNNSLKDTILAFKPFTPDVVIKNGIEDLEKFYDDNLK